MDNNNTSQHYPHQEAPPPPAPAPFPFRPQTADGHALHDDDYQGGETTPLTPSANGGTYHNQYGGEQSAAGAAAGAAPTSLDKPSDDQPANKRRLAISKKTQKRLYW